MAFGDWEFPHSSYYDSDLRELIRFYKEMKAIVDDLNQKYQELLEEWEQVEKDFAALTAKVDNLDTDVEKLRIEVKDIQTHYDELLLLYEQMVKYAQSLDKLIDEKIRENNLKWYEKLAELKHELQSQIDDLYKKISELDINDVFNRLEGYEQNIVDVLQDYFEGLRVHAITCSEYDQLQLSVNSYDSYRLTVREYAIDSRDRLNDYWIRAFINPWNGFKTTAYNVDSWNCTEFLDSIKANEYSDLELTNDEYDARNLTVFEYYSLSA